MNGADMDLFKAFNDGWGWGDYVYEKEVEYLRNESQEDKVVRLNRIKEEDALLNLDINSFMMQKYSEKVAIRAKRFVKKGQVVRKRPFPCKWVCGEHVGEDCWAWEYTDPRTNTRKKPHTCEFLHPGETGWNDEWLLPRA
jgi:hypothetical protein